MTHSKTRGVIAPMFAVLLPVLVIFCAIAINLAQMQLTQTELKIATDAAARAGGRAWSKHQDLALAREAARQAASLNNVNGQPLLLSTVQADGEIEFGKTAHSGDERYGFTLLSDAQILAGETSSAIRVNAAHVTPLFLRVGDTQQFTPRATSVASQIDRDIAMVIDRSGSMAYFENEYLLYTTITDLYEDPSNNIPHQDYIDAVTDYQPVPALAALPLNNRKYSAAVMNHLDGKLLEYAQTLNSRYRNQTGVPDHSRWALLEQAEQAFFQVLNSSDQEEQVSVTSFASQANVDVPLTYDLASCEEAIDDMYPNGSTAIGDGLLDAIGTLANGRPQAIKTIIVFTDGKSKKGIDPEAAANQIVANHPDITIHTVTFSVGADQTAMQDVAAAANGKHRHANDGTQLIAIFRELAASFRTIITE